MVFEKFVLKAACLAATILLVAACETPVEEGKQTTGTGGAKQETQVAKSGQESGPERGRRWASPARARMAAGNFVV